MVPADKILNSDEWPSLNNFIFGTKKEWKITLKKGGGEKNKITVLVNISILNGMAQGIYYSFFVMAKISVLVTIIMFNHLKTKNRSFYLKTLFILHSKHFLSRAMYKGWNFNSDNYLFTTDTK